MIRGVAVVAVSFIVAALGGRADAGVVINVEQVGNDTVASGGGTLNLTDLTFVSEAGAIAAIITNPAYIGMGPIPNPSGNSMDAYQGLTGPATFGTATRVGNDASSGSGDLFAFNSAWDAPPLGPTVFVPIGYTSGTELSATDTYSGQTFASLGLTAGTYTWTWGTGADADSLTVNISVASVPEPSSLALAGTAALAGLGLWARRRAAAFPSSV
jgi:hypothetical protein